MRCLRGAIWDVVVDLRPLSKSFGGWFATILSTKNGKMMYVPEGFAHGFISLESDSEVFYLVSHFYEPSAEGTLIWDDPNVGIAWPMQPQVISIKDSSGLSLRTISKKRLV